LRKWGRKKEVYPEGDARVTTLELDIIGQKERQIAKEMRQFTSTGANLHDRMWS